MKTTNKAAGETAKKRSFYLGKIDYDKRGRKINAVTVDLEIRQKGGEAILKYNPNTKEYAPTGERCNTYLEIALSAMVWNAPRTDIVCGGQCFDELKPYLWGKPQFRLLYKLWEKAHLKNTTAGTPEQEEAVNNWLAEGNPYDYEAICKMLKEKSLYTVNFTGKVVGSEIYNNTPYTYGTKWVINEYPAEIIQKAEQLINDNNE